MSWRCDCSTHARKSYSYWISAADSEILFDMASGGSHNRLLRRWVRSHAHRGVILGTFGYSSDEFDN